jgi:mono/diheme cytochrome c family protein
MRRPVLALGLWVASVVVLGAGPLAAQTVKRETARPIVSILGADNFDEYCAVCHGMDGKGRGPAAPAMKMPMPDLTKLTSRNGGAFSHSDVERAILGKGSPTPAHGSEEMPIWGQVFRSFDQDPSVRALRITNLVKYIEKLQQK